MGFSDFTHSLSEKTKHLADTAKGWKDKTLKFAWDHIAKTPLFLETEEEYSDVLQEKRVILLAFDEDAPVHTDIILMLPVWQTKAFMDVAKFRYLSTNQSASLVQSHKYTMPVEMRVFLHGSEILRLNDVEAIRRWWSSDRVYTLEGASLFQAQAIGASAAPSPDEPQTDRASPDASTDQVKKEVPASDANPKKSPRKKVTPASPEDPLRTL